MKRTGALVCLIIMVVSMFAPAVFAEDNSENSVLKIESSTPENNATGVSVENLSVKIYFNKEILPESKAVKESNAKQFKLTDADGNKIPIKVYYSHKEKSEGLLMVVSDVIDSDIEIKGNTDYSLTIGKNFEATDGTKLGTVQKIDFKTLDKSKSTTVYTIMMIVMIVGIIFFSSRSAKKAAEKESGAKKPETVNPYKEAKRTGKSVEEIVAKDQQKKAKYAEAVAKQKAKMAELEAEEEAERKAASTKRVSSPKPISAAGSEYKVKVVTTAEVKAQKKKNSSTNPKNQTGKQKNSKNKSKKK